MVETSFDHAAAATALGILVSSTRADLTRALPTGRVAPLYSTDDSGAIVKRQGPVVREPVKRKVSQTPGTR